MIFVLLWLLATVDTAFIGYREAAGRSALIGKRSYYRRAMIRGALFGQLAVVLAGMAAAAVIVLSSEPRARLDEFQQAARCMAVVFVPYATVLFAAFAIRSIPSVDIRSITSVVIFGPFTLIRPLIVALGVTWGFACSPSFATGVLGTLVLVMMLSLERVLSALRKKGRID